MIAILLALGASASWGVGDFLGGISSRRLSALTVLAVSQVAGLAALAVVAVAVAEPPPGAGTLAYAAGAGVVAVVGLGALYRGMAVGAIAIVAPVSAAGAVVPLAVGLARGERPAPLQLAGIGLVLAGVALASHERGPAGGRLAAGAALALLAALGFGLYFVFIDGAAATSPLWAVLVARATSSLLALGAAAAAATRRPAAGDLPVLAAIGLFDVAANGLLVLALTRGPISVVPVLASLYPVVTVLLARGLLGERVAAAQQTGVVLALVGVGLISAGR